MFFLYNVLSVIVAIFAWPILLFKKKARFGIKQKLGIVPNDVKARMLLLKTKPIWFHAVSVGEFNAALPLLLKLKDAHPDQPIVISTSTGAGQKHAREKASEWAEIIYFPYDLFWATRNWIDAIGPQLVVIVETELWPGFINTCHSREIPIAVVNGRISPRSYRNYYKLRSFIGPVLNKLDAVGAQSKQEAERYRALAGEHLRIEVLGNLKFDGLKRLDEDKINDLRSQLGLASDAKVMVAGSTHEGEESFLLSAFKQGDFAKEWKLVIVPRHPERFDRAAEIIKQAGFEPIRYTRNGNFASESNGVYLLDAIGHLNAFYSIATLAFVGGTLVPIGGHNVAEPCIYDAPVLTGTNLQKTRDVADALKTAGALTEVVSVDEMVALWKTYSIDVERRNKDGQAGGAWLAQNFGAVERAMKFLESLAVMPPKLISAPGSELLGSEFK